MATQYRIWTAESAGGADTYHTTQAAALKAGRQAKNILKTESQNVTRDIHVELWLTVPITKDSIIELLEHNGAGWAERRLKQIII